MIHKLPHRICYVPGWATVFHVPQHIVRVDIDDPGLAGTHGWQVRYQKRTRPSKFFSDNCKRKRRSPAVSLKEASGYLESIYAGRASGLRRVPSRIKCNLIMTPGIRVIVRRNRRKTFAEMYIEVCSPYRGRATRRIYVGTEKTATPERLIALLPKADAERVRMEREFIAEKRWR